MDIFDILSKKIKYRRFSNREKILLIVFILLFLEFLFYNFLIKREAQKISEVNFNENIEVEEPIYKYNGLADFSNENLDKIASENNLSRDNFTKDGKTDIDTLLISGNVNNSEINKISALTNYYGYSNIELNRIDENSFSYRLKAEKPSKAIYYSDLKKAYFNENEQDKKIEAQNKKEEINPKKSEEIVKVDQLKNTEAAVIKNSKSENISKNSKDIDNKIKGTEVSSSNIDINLKPEKDKFKYANPILFDDFKTKIKKDREYKFIVDDNVKTNYYSESGITSFYINAENIRDIVKLGVEKHCDGISLSLFFPYDSCKEIGIINISGEQIPFTGEIHQDEWFRINLFAYDISYIYFLPQNNEDLFFFVKEVEYNDEI